MTSSVKLTSAFALLLALSFYNAAAQTTDVTSLPTGAYVWHAAGWYGPLTISTYNSATGVVTGSMCNQGSVTCQSVYGLFSSIDSSFTFDRSGPGSQHFSGVAFRRKTDNVIVICGTFDVIGTPARHRAGFYITKL